MGQNHPFFLCHTDVTLKTTMKKTSNNHYAYSTINHFCLIAIPKQELKILWWPVVINYGKISFLVDMSKMMIYLILIYSSILYFKWQYLKYYGNFLFSPFSIDITQVTCKISDLNVNFSQRYWFLKRVTENVNTLLL